MGRADGTAQRPEEETSYTQGHLPAPEESKSMAYGVQHP